MGEWQSAADCWEVWGGRRGLGRAACVGCVVYVVVWGGSGACGELEFSEEGAVHAWLPVGGGGRRVGGRERNFDGALNFAQPCMSRSSGGGRRLVDACGVLYTCVEQGDSVLPAQVCVPSCFVGDEYKLDGPVCVVRLRMLIRHVDGLREVKHALWNFC